MKATRIFENIEEIETAKNKTRLLENLYLGGTILAGAGILLTGHLLALFAGIVILFGWADLQAEKNYYRVAAQILANRVVLVQEPNGTEAPIISKEEQAKQDEIQRVKDYLKTLEAPQEPAQVEQEPVQEQVEVPKNEPRKRGRPRRT